MKIATSGPGWVISVTGSTEPETAASPLKKRSSGGGEETCHSAAFAKSAADFDILL